MKIQLIDLKKNKNKNFILSDVLISKIKNTISLRKKVILYLNRRGFHNFILCRQCGYKFKCKNCDIHLKVHKTSEKQFFLCHICSYMQNIPDLCPNCKSTKIDNIGFGTQMLEKEIKYLFPNYSFLRIDADTLKNKNSYKLIYEKLAQTDIILGTSSIIKGIKFHNIGLIAVALADIGLHIPDFTTNTQFVSNLIQLVSNAEQNTKIYIQAYDTDNILWKYILNMDYFDFYKEELKERKIYFYPPFVHLSKIYISMYYKTKAKNKAMEIYQSLKSEIKNQKYDISIYLSVPLVFKKFNKYTYNIILKGNNDHIGDLLQKMKKDKYVVIDRDAISLTD